MVVDSGSSKLVVVVAGTILRFVVVGGALIVWNSSL